MKLGIIGAMDMEVENLRREMKNVTEKTVGFTRFFQGELFGMEVCLSQLTVGLFLRSLPR